MKKVILFSTCIAAAATMAACGGPGAKGKAAADTAAAETKAVPEYTVINNATVDLAGFPQDKDGYYVIFDGKTFNGWRGYGKDHVPSKWTIDNGAIKFNGSGGGEAQDGDGGDLIYISCPEYQVLDNENHPDAKLGVDGNRKSASLYDMIPAVPQNAKPYGEWNKAKIMVYKGTVVHGQNDQNVLEYHLWTPQWTEMLEKSKFSPEKWPLAFELLNNCGGAQREGYIGFQDHGDDVWFRNIRIKVLD